METSTPAAESTEKDDTAKATSASASTPASGASTRAGTSGSAQVTTAATALVPARPPPVSSALPQRVVLLFRELSNTELEHVENRQTNVNYEIQNEDDALALFAACLSTRPSLCDVTAGRWPHVTLNQTVGADEVLFMARGK